MAIAADGLRRRRPGAVEASGTDVIAATLRAAETAVQARGAVGRRLKRGALTMNLLDARDERFLAQVAPAREGVLALLVEGAPARLQDVDQRVDVHRRDLGVVVVGPNWVTGNCSRKGQAFSIKAACVA